MRATYFKLAGVALAASLAAPAQAQTEIQWWHSMSAALGEWVNDLAKGFNESQSEYKVVPTFKGSYDESMSAAIAAFRAGNAPHILQVFEVGTATMMASRKAIVPVAQVMKDAGMKFDPGRYVPAVAGYYTASDGQMLSFPFNSSTTIFHYNKDAFKAAGLDPKNPPKTWPEVVSAAAKLKASGHKCPLTTSWVSWTQLESFSTWHNVEFSTPATASAEPHRLVVNSPLHVRHIENLGQHGQAGPVPLPWPRQRRRRRVLGRRMRDDHRHLRPLCARQEEGKFTHGIVDPALLSGRPGAPQNTVIGGASLWTMAGKSPEEYKGVAAFLNYLSSDKVAADNHMRTGYLPVTTAAYQMTEKSGFYKENPGTDVAVTQMIRKTTDKSRGIRIGNFLQVRAIIDEELEQVWAGKKEPKEALEKIVKRGNEQLARFQQANK